MRVEGWSRSVTRSSLVQSLERAFVQLMVLRAAGNTKRISHGTLLILSFLIRNILNSSYFTNKYDIYLIIEVILVVGRVVSTGLSHQEGPLPLKYAQLSKGENKNCSILNKQDYSLN